MVTGWLAAIRGMRNPMNSWNLSDTMFDISSDLFNPRPEIGPNDLSLMLKLAKAGTDHRKYLRMIHIQCDIIAPLYWWKDYDTYKIGTTANSCSTMHKLHSKPISIFDFSTEYLDEVGRNILETVISYMNYYREDFVATGNKDSWRKMIQMLPTNYNQKRTIDINYETALNIINARRNHKLQEFRDLCYILLDKCPYLNEIYECAESK